MASGAVVKTDKRTLVYGAVYRNTGTAHPHLSNNSTGQLTVEGDRIGMFVTVSFALHNEPKHLLWKLRKGNLNIKCGYRYSEERGRDAGRNHIFHFGQAQGPGQPLVNAISIILNDDTEVEDLLAEFQSFAHAGLMEDIGKKPTATSAEKVRKQKVLESVPHKIYDAHSKGTEEPVSIRRASKLAALEDTTPLYKPILRELKKPDLLIKELKETLKIPKSGDQIKDKGKSVNEKRLSPLVTSPPPKLKDVMVNPKVSQESAKVKVVTKKLADLVKKKSTAKHPPAQRKETIGKPARKDKVRDMTRRRAVSGFFETSARYGPLPEDADSHWDDTLRIQSGMSIATKVLKAMRDKMHESGDLNLEQFGIPDQRQLLTVALSSDTCRYDFGGNLRQYYSPVLKNYIPFNMLERYRGSHPTSPCLTAVDVRGLGTKENFLEKDLQKRKAVRDKTLDDLHEASIDETHYEFLKSLLDNQPVSLPLTLVHDIALEVLPMINKMQAFYNKKLGPNHECTEQATESFIKMLNRTMMYNSM